jgi:predicted RNA binding protein YcfA (HicA-like mRNA interferase family)
MSPLWQPRKSVILAMASLLRGRRDAGWGHSVTFNELTRLLEENGFRLVRQKGAIRYYGKAGWARLIRVDYHGARQVPTGTCHAILKAAGIPKP